MGYKPYPRQQEAIDKMVSFINSKSTRKGIFVYPTAYGKSLIISNVASKFPDKYFINIAPNKELCEQNYQTYISYGFEASICSASVGFDEVGKVTFATIGTLKKHIEFFKNKEVVILVDECHGKSKPDSQLDIFFRKLKKAKLVGTTATPVRLANGFGGSELKMMNRMRDCIFTSIEDIVQISEVIKENRWTPLIYRVEQTDETSLKFNSTGSDYTLESLKKFSEDNDIVQKCIETAKSIYKEGRKSSIIYVATIEEASKIEAGLEGCHMINGKTNKSIRSKLVKDFKEGKFPFLVNVGVFIEGFDYPELASIIMARPTNSLTIYYQTIGRVVRKHKNKKDALVIDLAGNFNKFGKVEELTIEEVPYYGWGVFNGNGELLTNYPMKAMKRPTKESLMKSYKQKHDKKIEEKNPKFTFGMFKGERLWDIARDEKKAPRLKSYCSWLYDKHTKGEWNFYGSEGESLKKGIKEFLKV